MNRLKKLHELGQSAWLDTISRDLIDSGQLANLIEKGEVYGVTSNPTIFEQAITGGGYYEQAIRERVTRGRGWKVILDDLILSDIGAAADLFLPLYEGTQGQDGFVSVEVDPALADETAATVREAKRLWQTLKRPNVMIKIPATKAGIGAISSAIAEGINVNVTLIFDLDRYTEVMQAYLSGLEERLAAGGAIDQVASVASFFVSRVDTAVDQALRAHIQSNPRIAERAAMLMGKAAIANAKLAYAQFKAFFASERFQDLSDRGAQLQRPLWASTSTKNPDYPDTYYVDHLIGPHTVNTLPAATLDAFRDHGVVQNTLEARVEEVQALLKEIEALGVSMREVTFRLEREGVEKFAQSFTNLQAAVRRQVEAVQNGIGGS